MKKIILGLAIGSLFLTANCVCAQVFINEVQLNPTENRFIELYNSGSSSVSLTDYYIQRKTATGDFTSLISKTNFENKTINAGEYFLISRSSLSGADIVLSSLTLTENNTIQIKNSEQEVIDKIGWGDCNDNCVISNPSENKSIQKVDGTWVIADPTPKSLNSGSNISNENNNNNNNNDENNTQNEENNTTTVSSSSSNTSNTSKKEDKIIPVFTANILAPKLVFVGQVIDFDLQIKYGSDTYMIGKYFWNFGDGSFMEEKDSFKKFQHIYYYPGEYQVSVEYFKNKNSVVPDAVSKFILKVVPLSISISKVGDVKDFFIELTNNASYDMDISNWKLVSFNKVFYLPKNTVILSKKQMTLSNRITGFTFGDQMDLKLYSSIGELIFDFNFLDKKTYSTSVKKVSNVNNINQKENISSVEEKEEINLNSENLTANVEKVSSSLFKNKNLYIYAFFIFLLASVILFTYAILNKKKEKIGDDFEILDE